MSDFRAHWGCNPDKFQGDGLGEVAKKIFTLLPLQVVPFIAAQLAGCPGLGQSKRRRAEGWEHFEQADLRIRTVGSVAYKLALVSAGLADATFTLTPKHEWDVAAGAALVESAGGFVTTLQDTALSCNNKSPKLSGLVAGGPFLKDDLTALIRRAQNSSPSATLR